MGGPPPAQQKKATRNRHTTAKNHICQYCQRRFARSEHLKRHLRRHTLEKPYKCKICSVCFSRKELHDRHQITHHQCSRSSFPSPEILPSHVFATEPKNIVDLDSSMPNTRRSADDADNSVIVAFPFCPSSDATLHLNPFWSDMGQYSLEGINSLDPTLNLPTPVLLSEATSLTDWGSNGISTGKTTQDIPPLLLDNTIDSTAKPVTQELPEEQQNHVDIRPRQISPLSSLSISSLDDSDFWSVPSDELNNSRTSCSPLLDVFSWPGSKSGYVATESTQITEPRIHVQLLNTIKQALSKNQVQQSDGRVEISEAQLDKYLAIFFATLNQHFPCIHESNTSSDNDAVTVALIAGGAMYCSKTQVGTALFEISRRMAGEYMEISQSQTIPPWVLRTLLYNFLFGFPGGNSQSMDSTLGSLGSLARIAASIQSLTTAPSQMEHSTLEVKWNSFVDNELRKRSIFGVLIVVGMWSTVYGSIDGAAIRHFNQVHLPAPEMLWKATAADEWQKLSVNTGSRPLPRFRDTVDAVFANKAYSCSGMASLSIIVGILISADELRSSSHLLPENLKGHITQAVENWSAMHNEGSIENADVNFVAYPTAAYIRLSLQVDIKLAMAMFITRDFQCMRATLRSGNLFEATKHALDGLSPWAMISKIQILMVSIPFTIVISEWALLISESSVISTSHRELLSKIGEALGLLTQGSAMTPRVIWKSLNHILENGPVILALSTAIDAYSNILPDSVFSFV